MFREHPSRRAYVNPWLAAPELGATFRRLPTLEIVGGSFDKADIAQVNPVSEHPFSKSIKCRRELLVPVVLVDHVRLLEGAVQTAVQAPPIVHSSLSWPVYDHTGSSLSIPYYGSTIVQIKNGSKFNNLQNNIFEMASINLYRILPLLFTAFNSRAGRVC